MRGEEIWWILESSSVGQSREITIQGRERERERGWWCWWERVRSMRGEEIWWILESSSVGQSREITIQGREREREREREGGGVSGKE